MAEIGVESWEWSVLSETTRLKSLAGTTDMVDRDVK